MEAVDTVEQSLERLGLATPTCTPEQQQQQQQQQQLVEPNNQTRISITMADPLQVDLPRIIQYLLTILQSLDYIPESAQTILQKLQQWDNNKSNEVLNWISALLLAEGTKMDLITEQQITGSERWKDGEFTQTIAQVFRPLLVDLVARWTTADAHAQVFHHLMRHGDWLMAVAYAAGCLLPTVPQIKSLVMLVLENQKEPTEMELQQCVVWYRLLCHLPEAAGNGWDWGTMFARVLNNKESSDTMRVAACQALCLVKGYGDPGRQKLLNGNGIQTETMARVLVWLVHGQQLTTEWMQAQMVRQNQINQDQQLWDAETSSLAMSDLCDRVANVGGVLLHAHSRPPATDTTLVVTNQVAASLRSVALATSRNEPVLLHGPSGSGKTTLVEWMARQTGNQLVTVHVNGSMDAKVLLGNYVTTQKAGDFEWQPGLLTTAVTEGQWVLVEDIDMAPSDVIQTLVPLLESHMLFVANRGESIRANVGFRLFATLSGNSGMPMEGLLGSSMWTKVNVEGLENEWAQIIAGVFPSLQTQAEALAKVFGKIAGVMAGGKGQLSTSDLIKWCRRISNYANASGAADKFGLFQEAIDALTLREPDYQGWRELAEKLGAMFGIPSHRVHNYLDQYSPEIERPVGHSRKIGRATLQLYSGKEMEEGMPFADTRHARCLLERIASCVELSEPVLLTGETGTGKTTAVQHVARLTGRSLSVFNLSQQSDSSDLLGGFRPVDITTVALQLREQFLDLFGRTFNADKNAKFLESVRKSYATKKWKRLAELCQTTADRALQDTERRLNKQPEQSKRARHSQEDLKELKQDWQRLKVAVQDFAALRSARLVFRFMEGALVRAARRGEWLLLDEINLASAETLACLGGLLQRHNRFLVVAETGERIQCHPEFRMFGCMNPATDAGKRDLPQGLRRSFTEVYVHAPDSSDADLLAIIGAHLPQGLQTKGLDARAMRFYRLAKEMAAGHRLVDGANRRPHYSLRSLTRSLTYAREHCQAYGLARALYDGLSMAFVTQLTGASQGELDKELQKTLADVRGFRESLAQQPQQGPPGSVCVQGFWLPTSSEAAEETPRYEVTRSVAGKLRALSRAVMCGRYPVLIQGPTSAGKTSMVQHLASATGHRFVRINNHEHTDLQEYLGAYASVDGRLVFQEGLLVRALRYGHWLVLDELNLAPSDVLEALNRLLDDNRELVIPETQEVVRPHPHFMLFATQNPAGLYGGRKQLSRAFRNRFVELHFDDLPEDELKQIITTTCQVPPSHAELLVKVYGELTRQRQATRVFEASHGYVTLRDLFRWANRHAGSLEELAEHGYMLLAERVRSEEEKALVKECIEKVIYPKGRRRVDVEALYSMERLQGMPEFRELEAAGIAWTRAMRRLFMLTALCVRAHEPVLLVGETGCGKTTVCQLLAQARQQNLLIVNCHQNTESSDILGGQRPVRNRAQLIAQARQIIHSVGLDQAAETPEALKGLVTEENREKLEPARELLVRAQNLFAWHDGPLVQAMKQGDMFLMDELNLADDSVLERLNSVLEPSRTLVLAEQSGAVDELKAQQGFEVVATMNPGGDYGKRELSPALRNRFTELWAPATVDEDDLRLVLERRLDGVPEAPLCNRVILGFIRYLREDLRALANQPSLRDYLFWADFVVSTHALVGARQAVVHGACLVLLDAVGTQAAELHGHTGLKAKCVEWLRRAIGSKDRLLGVESAHRLMVDNPALDLKSLVVSQDNWVGVVPFMVECGSLERLADGFALHAPTTFDNVVKILRAMQVGKPLLLEGSPGVGKTTLVAALARLAGHNLVRINLSDQTDLMDLFGTDLPTDDGTFAWCDAPFLQALRRGDWVLLDEINLASQSVLEGLNSCLDHRGTVYISELDREFKLSRGFRLFAAQNPLAQGGGRKGLPRSFVNRFTQVCMDELNRTDLQTICAAAYPQSLVVEKVLRFNDQMHAQTMVSRRFAAQGAPWEFNLRDVNRLMGLLDNGVAVPEAVEMLYCQRMRTLADRRHVEMIYKEVFEAPLEPRSRSLHFTSEIVQVGSAALSRKPGGQVSRLSLLHGQSEYVESLMRCVQMRWLAILVGAGGVGKTAMVRWLAHATGSRLVEFAMNSGVDTSELLGGFEQVDAQRHRAALLRALDRLVDSQPTNQLLVGLLHQAHSTQDTAGLCAVAMQMADSDEEIHRLVGSIRRTESGAAGKFEWVDGILVDALIQGHWLLIDRANLCSASVLDRLNGLLEPNGVLYVNEDPKRTAPVVPHRDFRIFMAVDPQYGELSRAMRNRGIEIHVLPDGITLGDQRVLGESVGLPRSLSARENSLTGLVQTAAALTEQIQRGGRAEDMEVEAVVRSFAPSSGLDSVVAVSAWQSQMLSMNEGQQRMLLAVLSASSPEFTVLSNTTKCSTVLSLLTAGQHLVQAIVEARHRMAVADSLVSQMVRSAPLYLPTNHGLNRYLLSAQSSEMLEYHQALCETLQFHRERQLETIHGVGELKSQALRRSDVDAAFYTRLLDLVAGIDQLIDSYECNVTSGSVMYVRGLFECRQRMAANLVADRMNSTELSVVFKTMSKTLPHMDYLPVADKLLDSVQGLVSDASYSLRVWSMLHPETLADNESRQLEQTLVKALENNSDGQQVVEALAMLYATSIVGKRTLVRDAISKFAQDLLPKETKPPVVAATPADVLADISQLFGWKKLALLALEIGVCFTQDKVEELKRRLSQFQVNGSSEWAVMYTRLIWSVNDKSVSGLLGLAGDLEYHRCWQLRGSPIVERFGHLLKDPGARMTQAVETELTWGQELGLSCTLDNQQGVVEQCQALMKAIVNRVDNEDALVALRMELDAMMTYLQIAVRVVLPDHTVDVGKCQWDELLELVNDNKTALLAAQAIHKAVAIEPLSPTLVYVAKLEMALCMLALAIPGKRPVDPAARAHTRYNWLTHNIDVARADLHAHQQLQLSTTGTKDNEATRPWSQKLAVLEQQRSEIALVYRPCERENLGVFDELWQDARNLLETGARRARELTRRMADEGAVRSLLKMFEQFELRLRARHFGAYRDVAQLWCMFVRQAGDALTELMRLSRVEELSGLKERAQQSVLVLYRQPMSVEGLDAPLLISQIKTLARRQSNTDLSSQHIVYGDMLACMALRATWAVQVRGWLDKGELEFLGAVFADAYDTHRRAADERRKREAEAASLFKSRGTKEQTDEDLQQELFPAFDDVYEDEEEKENEEEKTSVRDVPERALEVLVACHQYVMLQFSHQYPAADIQSGIIGQNQLQAFRLAARIHKLHPELTGVLDTDCDNMLKSANLMSLAQITRLATGGDDTANPVVDGVRLPHVYDFYRGPAPQEAVLLKPIAQKLGQRASELLEEWPDHTVLQQIQLMSQRLLQFPTATPLAKLLAGLEQLHEQASTNWEAYASRDVSLGEPLGEATQLIIRWRQRELHGWPHLLRAQEMQFCRRTTEWWFNLYAALILSSGEFSELVSALDQFMQGSPAGEFRSRLNMLCAFAAHRSSMSIRDDMVLAPLTNAIAYYSQFTPCIADQLAGAKKQVSKDLSQYVKISSWQDVNPAAMRASAQKTHRYLTKCVRRWREALCQPIFQIIQAHQTAMVVTARVPEVQVVELPLKDAGIEIAQETLASILQSIGSRVVVLEVDEQMAGRAAGRLSGKNAAMAKVLKSCPSSLRQLVKMIGSSGLACAGKDGTDTLDEFATQIVGDVNYFQNMETPKHLVRKPSDAISDDNDRKQKKKQIIKSRHQKQETEQTDREYVEDDEERQRLIRQFWGEQRNRRRTRLAEIIKALEEIGLSRHSRHREPVETNTGGLAGVLRSQPMDVQQWQQAVAILAKCHGDVMKEHTLGAQQNWLLADAGYFRLLAQLTQLRNAMTTCLDTNAELTPQRVQHIGGVAESLCQLLGNDRAQAAGLLEMSTKWMGSAVAWSSNAGQKTTNDCQLDRLERGTDELTSLLVQFKEAAKTLSVAVDSVVDQTIAEFDQARNKLMAVMAATRSLELNVGSKAVSFTSQLESVQTAVSEVMVCAQDIQELLVSNANVYQHNSLSTWVTSICDCIQHHILAPTVSTTDVSAGINDEECQLTGYAGKWITAVMKSWQEIHSIFNSSADEKESNAWGMSANELTVRIKQHQQLRHALFLPQMCELSDELVKMSAVSNGNSNELVFGIIRPWAQQYSQLVQMVLARHSEFHRTAIQFALTITTVLTTVVVHGLGSNDMYDGEEEQDSGGQGTGMGVGEGSTAGAKNVSDEIESEAQVEGLKGDEDKDESEQPETNEDDAIDMEGDFEGTLGDADLETDDEDSSDEDKDKDEDADDDEQLGDVDPTDPTALDDKLWDDDKKEDKKNDDTQVDQQQQQQQQQQESDMVAGSDNESETGQDDDKKGGEDAVSEEEDEEDGESEEDEGVDEGELDDKVNQDTLDRMADVEDQGEQLEMPEDLNIDMDDEGDTESDGEGEDGLEDDMGELPEDEPIEQKKDEGEDNDAKDEDEQDVRDETAMDEVQEEEEEEEDNDDEKDDGSGLDKPGDAVDEEKEEGDEAMDDGEDENEKDKEIGGEDAPEEDTSKEAERTGEDKPVDGNDTAMNMDGTEETDVNATAEASNTVSSSAQQQDQHDKQQQQQTTSASSVPSSEQQKPQQDQQQEQEQQQQQERDNMDPERTLADTIEKWERRLNIVMREEEEQKTEEVSENQQPAENNTDYEHVAENDKHDKVALADANEEEVAKQQEDDLQIGQEDKQKEDEEDIQAMDVDDDEEEEKAGDTEKEQKMLSEMQPPTSRREMDQSSEAAQMQQSEADNKDKKQQQQQGDEDEDKEMEDAVVDGEDVAMKDEEEDEQEQKEEEEEEGEVIDVVALREELEALTAAWHNGEGDQDSEQAQKLWQSYVRITHDLSLMLTEQLRLILTPTQATQLRGDYRTGKRLNMKRIIPYIASDFRKDKIWLRRTKPARREYQVMVALDNSKSMAQSTHAVELAYETLALVTTALAQLEVGQLSVVSFGEKISLLHPFDVPFNAEAGARVLSRLNFADDSTNVVQLMDASLQLFGSTQSAAPSDLWRLQLVISDGVCNDHARLLRQVRAAMENRIMVVFIVLDRPALSSNSSSADKDADKFSIMQLQSWYSGADGKMQFGRYLDTFPFKYYVVLRNVDGLPAVLADTLRQYFSLVASD